MKYFKIHNEFSTNEVGVKYGRGRWVQEKTEDLLEILHHRAEDLKTTKYFPPVGSRENPIIIHSNMLKHVEKIYEEEIKQGVVCVL